MDTMRSLLLLSISLITGCQALKVCKQGWLQFSCRYPETVQGYESIFVVLPQRRIPSTKKNEWNTSGRFSLYHDTKTKNLNVTIRRLQQLDSGEYHCVFQESKSDVNSDVKSDPVDLEVEDDKNCQAFTQTAYRTAKTTMSCGHKGNSGGSHFFCKDHRSICEDILSTRSSLRSNGTFNLTANSSSFNVSISNVSSQHAGVYWCGQEADGGRYRAALRQIVLEVKATIRNFTKSPAVGQSLTYWCQYETQRDTKFICKGEDPSICEPLVTTERPNAGRFSMKDDREKRNITITVRDVTSEDTGTYWCGARTSDQTRSNPFFHRLNMTVAAAAGSQLVVITVIVCVAALLLFVLILRLIYKRRSKKQRHAAAQLNAQDYTYEEIRVGPQNPDPGHPNTIYVTANFPTIPSASLHYSTINFHQRPGGAGGEAPTIKPSSSVCEYSTVRDSHCPTGSTVHHPSSEDPVYSAVYKPRQP